jgi:hypothetical protein
LKKSAFPNEQNFPEVLVRISENYMGRMIRLISDRQPSQNLYEALDCQQLFSPGLCEILPSAAF